MPVGLPGSLLALCDAVYCVGLSGLVCCACNRKCAGYNSWVPVGPLSNALNPQLLQGPADPHLSEMHVALARRTSIVGRVKQHPAVPADVTALSARSNRWSSKVKGQTEGGQLWAPRRAPVPGSFSQ